MDGELRVESAPGKGSEFHFRIRLATVADKGHEKEQRVAMPLAPQRLLLLEPRPASRAAILHQLAALPIDLVCADAPAALLALLHQGIAAGKPWDRVVLGWHEGDSWLPEVLQEVATLAAPPAILLITSGDPAPFASHIAVQGLAICDVLAHPFTPQALCQAVMCWPIRLPRRHCVRHCVRRRGATPWGRRRYRMQAPIIRWCCPVMD